MDDALAKNPTSIDCSALENSKLACLTLDLEQDYGDLLDEPSYEGLEHIRELASFLVDRNIPLTCFVQASLLETHPNSIQQLFDLDIEFELHSYSHPKPTEMDIKFEIEKGKEVYRKFFNKDPVGYRAPQGVVNNQTYYTLVTNGFKFDSSVFPSLRPGSFNNLRVPTSPYIQNNHGITELPFTVLSPVVRIPVALSYIKLFGKPYAFLLKTLSLPKLIVFDFHLHDLFNLTSLNKIPLEKYNLMYRTIFRRIYCENKSSGLNILDEFVTMLQKRGYIFLKLEEIYEMITRQESA